MTAPLPFPLPFQKGENGISTAETVTEWNGPIFAKRALSVWVQPVSVVVVLLPIRERAFWAF